MVSGRSRDGSVRWGRLVIVALTGALGGLWLALIAWFLLGQIVVGLPLTLLVLGLVASKLIKEWIGDEHGNIG